jgi:hypothetical protein
MKELIQIQQRLKAPKKNKNTFGGYNYRSCEDILEAAKPICHELGCLINICDEIVEVGGRIYVKATASIYNADGQCFSATAYAREEETKKGMDAAQITGSASSYARKYALNGLLAIDDTKDADTNEYQHRTTEAEPEQKTRSSITAIHLDDQAKCNKLLAWAYKAYQKNPEGFDAGGYLAKSYDITQQIRNRFDALFNSYLSAISNKK